MGGSGTASPAVALQSAHERWVASAGTQLLVVDPDVEQPGLRGALAGRGVHLTWTCSTIDALVEFGRNAPQAVVVAVGTPGIAAEEFVAALRRHGSPYVMAAGESVTADVGDVLMAGAGAWLRRPYGIADLWERLVAAPRPIQTDSHLTVGPLELDVAAYRVSIDDRRLPDLPLKEFELLRALMLRSPEVVADAELRLALWGEASATTRRNSIATHVTRLRVRLGPGVVLRRVRGQGYALSVDDGVVPVVSTRASR